GWWRCRCSLRTARTPGWGSTETERAPAVALWATTVPQDELRTVPPVLAVPPVLPWARGAGEEETCAAAWLACGRRPAAATLDWSLAGEAKIPAPSSDTTSRPPAVAAAAPSSHAPAPTTMPGRMRPQPPTRRL